MMVRNDSISDISATTAKAYATIIDLGQGIKQHGHCWSTNIGLTITENENMTVNGQADNTGTYISTLTGLSPGTKYYVRAYLQNGGVVVYGTDILSFTTLFLSIPVVTTGSVTDILTSGAKVTGNLSSLGEGASSVTQHGHCWSSETTTPIIEDDYKSSLGSTDKTGNFESQLVGLSENTTYYVRAYATNDAGTAYGNTVEFTTYGQIYAGFDANPKSGYVPLNVQFTDRSVGNINSWSWNFGDGGTSTAQNPLHTYNNQGIYTVTLNVGDGFSSDSEIKTNFITVNTSGVAPVADFTADKTSITAGQTVNFTDLSINGPTSWSWNFGDGGTSASQNPSHQYNSEGVYTVTLSVGNSFGSDFETKTNCITVLPEQAETVTDYDGNVYNTVHVGSQVWMAENLRTTHYANGAALVNGAGAGDINASTTKYYFAYNDNEGNVSTYGRLYTWYAAMNGASSSATNPSGVQGVCPSGWHLPSDEEWKELEISLEMPSSVADQTGWRGTDQGTQLKMGGSSGFNAEGGGYRLFGGTFHDLGVNNSYLSATESTSYSVYRRGLDATEARVERGTNTNKSDGLSVRCVKN